MRTFNVRCLAICTLLVSFQKNYIFDYHCRSMSAESSSPSTLTINPNMDNNIDRNNKISNNDTIEKHNNSHVSINLPGNHVKEYLKKCDERCVSRWKIIWAFLSFLISVADVTVIIYLSYLHFNHSQDMMAWLMLLPIVLNFIGIFTFLSK